MSADLQQHKAQLFERLQTAVELELSTLPPYIVAFASIKANHNRIPAQILHGVFMEEMLHLVLAANVLSAIGGTVRLGKDNIPVYPLTLDFRGQRFSDREFEVDLQRFSPAAVKTFMSIEQPEGWAPAPKALAAVPEMVVDGDSIGQFYKQTLEQLEALCTQHGEAAVFSGDPGRQIDAQYYWFGGGKPIVVCDLASARCAIKVIVDQGEGAGSVFDGDRVTFEQRDEPAHFFRFDQIARQRRYVEGDGPGSPTGAAIAVDYSQVWPIKTNPKHADYPVESVLGQLSAEFNAEYSMMLHQLEEALTGNPIVLYTAIKNGMHRLARLATQMMSRPMPGDPDGQHGAPTFEWSDRLL